MGEKTRRQRTRKRSYVLQEQLALNDAASAIEQKLEISQIKLIQRRLDTLAAPAEFERQKRHTAVLAENSALKRRVAELEGEVKSLKESKAKTVTAESFDAIVARVGK